MKSKDIRHHLNALADCVQAREIDRARSMARTLFNRLLKTVYAQVRGQASAAIMRRLLELEIEIGGENGDFRDFDNGQMIDLFIRGDVAGHMQTAHGARADPFRSRWIFRSSPDGSMQGRTTKWPTVRHRCDSSTPGCVFLQKKPAFSNPRKTPLWIAAVFQKPSKNRMRRF